MHKRLWNKDFILMLQGNAVSAIGDLLYGVAIGYWVYEKTGSNALMGLMSSIIMFVSMFLSPFTGSIIDKCNRKWIIVGMDALRGLIMLVVGALAFTDALSVPAVLISACLAALCSVFFSPAVSTLMIDIIPRDDMVRGQSIYSGTVSLINLVGKAFSGILVTLFGVPWIILINGVSYLISAFTEMFIRVPRTVGQGARVTIAGVFKDFVVAVKTIFADPCLKLFVPALLILNLLGAGPFMLALPFCLEKGFTVDMYGYMMSVHTASSVLCVLLFGVVKFSPRFRYWIMAICFIISPVFYIFVYSSTDFLFMCVFLFFGAMLNAAGNTVFSASLMLALPEENRGAILGFVGAASTGGCALSSVIFGLLCDVFPMDTVFICATVLSVLPTLYYFLHKQTKQFVLEH